MKTFLNHIPFYGIRKARYRKSMDNVLPKTINDFCSSDTITSFKMGNEQDSSDNNSTVDKLTKLKNRWDFVFTFERLLTKPRQPENFLCVALFDIDFFGPYNDYYGEEEGDECLRCIGKAIKKLNEKINIYTARIGGGKFALIWFEKKIANVENTISLVVSSIQKLYIPHEKSVVSPYVTVSIGTHIMRFGGSGDVDSLYDLAEKALDAAKKNGRNQSIISYSDYINLSPLSETA